MFCDFIEYPMTVTIKQVAERAGVSFKTVSRVINGDTYVSVDTRERVMVAVRELGYRPNLSARHMRTQRSQVIGFITDEIATTPFAVNLIKGAQSEAYQHDRMLMVINTECDAQIEYDAIEMLLSRKVEGILYATMRHKIVNLPQSIREVPIVLANCETADHDLPSVVPNEIEGGYNATLALIERGRKHIAFIGLEMEATATIGRFQGFQQALAAHNIPLDERLLEYTDGQPNSGYEAAKRLLAKNTPLDAIFCGNDRVAMGAYEAIKEAGLRIPQDISVVGFDNQDVIAANLRPSLSTMALPHYEMGQWAMRHLLEHGEQDSFMTEQVQLPCPYIARASV
jgi:LacI family transcriptional regulator